MTRARSRRAAIIGFHGFGNLGDEAILAGIERLLHPLPIEVTTLIGGPMLSGSAPFPGARRLVPRRLLPTAASVRALRGVDLLLLGGGGLLNDHWPAVIPRYLGWVMAARLAGARVAWIGVGVGPIRRRAWRWMARLAARLSTLVLVRDAESAQLLGAVGRRVTVMADPALFLVPPPRPEPEPVLGLVVRPPAPGGDPAALTELLAHLADAGRSAGLEPRILLMAPSVDAAFAGAVADRIAAAGPRPSIEPLGETPAEALERLVGCAAVASVRLHGLLLSALAGVPCLPIAYDAKVMAAAEALDLGDLVAVPGRAARDDVAGLLRAAREPLRTARVAVRVAALRGTLDEARKLVGTA